MASNYKMSVRKRIHLILGYIKKYWYLVALIITMALISVISSLFVPVLIGESIDKITTKFVDFEFIINNSIKIIVLVIITYVSQWSLGIINNILTANVVRDIRKDAFKTIIKLPLSYIDTHPFGEVVSKVITDVDTFSDGLLMGFTELFTGVVTIVGTVIFMLTINWLIAVIVVVLTPLSIFVARFIASRIHKYYEEQSRARAKQTGFIDEMIQNIKTVQAFSHEDENSEEFKKLNEKLTEASFNAVFYSSTVNPSTRFVNAIIYAVCAFVGAIIILIEPMSMKLTVGKLTTLLSYSKEYMKPFNEISSVITELHNAFVCASKVLEIIEEDVEHVNRLAENIDEVSGDVEFSHVYFSYNSDKKLIEDLNLHVKKGMRVAIVGPTGSGKTTLINLLMRFYNPTGGNIYIDGTDIENITRESLREKYGMVLQDTWLKSGTIFENIKMGKPDATLEEVIEASKLTYAHYFIEKLKDGYNTIINEQADNLSAGEKQLLCITRVMLLMPPILILDEATSNIDTRTELKIQKSFQLLMKDKTSFIVAHRLSTVKDADIILVLKDGKIIEKGNHNELIHNKGFYYELYNSQFYE